MLNQHVFFLEEMQGAKPRQSVVLPPTQVEPQQEVFADAILDSSSARQKRHPLKWAVSLGAHTLVLIVLLLLPLYFSQGLNMQRLNMTLLIAPQPPPPPPPPAPVKTIVKPVARLITAGKLMQPRAIPKEVAVFKEAELPPDVINNDGVAGGVFGGIPGQGMVKAAAPAAPVAVAEGPKKPVVVGGNVKPPRLLSGPAPVYPVLARQSRIQGTVVIEAIIDEHGNVIEEKVISGHPLLIPAAMKAVSERKYEPTVLDGQPTPVDLRVEVNFHTD
jgi:periplasmic protein TonB